MLKKLLFIVFLFAISNSLTAQDIETGLVARFSFCGNLNDESGNGNDGEYMGSAGPTYITDVNGNENSALFFNGFSDWVKVAPSESINAPLGEATVACWVYYQSLAFGQWVPICAKTDGPNVLDRQYSLGINHTTGQVYWHSTYVATATLQLNTWYHIAVTYTPDMLKCYLNGIFIGEAEPVDPISQNEEPFEIGRDTPESTDYFNGVIDEMNVYNRALSAEDVLALKNYDGCNTSSVASPVEGSPIEVYPNPVISDLNIDFAKPGSNRHIFIYNTMGQTVFSSTIYNNQIEINTDGFQKGIYTLLIESEGGIYSQKFVK